MQPQRARFKQLGSRHTLLLLLSLASVSATDPLSVLDLSEVEQSVAATTETRDKPWLVLVVRGPCQPCVKEVVNAIVVGQALAELSSFRTSLSSSATSSGLLLITPEMRSLAEAKVAGSRMDSDLSRDVQKLIALEPAQLDGFIKKELIAALSDASSNDSAIVIRISLSTMRIGLNRSFVGELDFNDTNVVRMESDWEPCQWSHNWLLSVASGAVCDIVRESNDECVLDRLNRALESMSAKPEVFSLMGFVSKLRRKFQEADAACSDSIPLRPSEDLQAKNLLQLVVRNAEADFEQVANETQPLNETTNSSVLSSSTTSTTSQIIRSTTVPHASMETTTEVKSSTVTQSTPETSTLTEPPALEIRKNVTIESDSDSNSDSDMRRPLEIESLITTTIMEAIDDMDLSTKAQTTTRMPRTTLEIATETKTTTTTSTATPSSPSTTTRASEAKGTRPPLSSDEANPSTDETEVDRYLDTMDALLSREFIRYRVEVIFGTRSRPVHMPQEMPRSVAASDTVNVFSADRRALVEELCAAADRGKRLVAGHLRDVVYRTDVFKALVISVSSAGQALSASPTPNEAVAALRKYLEVMHALFPFKNFHDDARVYVQQMLNFVKGSNTSAILTDFPFEELRLRHSLSGADSSFSAEQWVGCAKSIDSKGNSDGSKAYSCALWQLFHVVTVEHAYRQTWEVISIDGGILWILESYVEHFYRATSKSLFLRLFRMDLGPPNAEAASSGASEAAVSAALWLWSAHNQLSQSLHDSAVTRTISTPAASTASAVSSASDAEDVLGAGNKDLFCKAAPFPSNIVCPLCYSDTSSSARSETRASTKNVLRYLYAVYTADKML